jgi:multiple sugar transport system permease protein
VASQKAAQRRRGLVGLGFIAPALAGLAALYIVPLMSTLVMSFSKTRPFGQSTFNGGANYTRLVHDPAFWNALKASGTYTAVVLLTIPIAVAVAAAIHEVHAGKNTYRVLFFLPVVTLPVAVGMVWRFIYNGDFGILNAVLGVFGVDGKAWVADPTVAIFAVAVVGIWMNLGTNVIILGAGLQGISNDVHEAAALDGAGRWSRFRHITLPLLTPSIFFVSVLNVISSFQMFDLIYVMIGRNSPALRGSTTMVYFFYQKAFVEYDRGYGATIAIVLLGIIMSLTLIQFRIQKKWVFYG